MATHAFLKRPYSFSLMLPLGQLLFCAVLILIFCGPRSLLPVTRTGYVEVKVTNRVTDQRASASTSPDPAALSQETSEDRSDRQMRITDRVLSSIWFLNVPGGMVQMKMAAYGRTHDGWIPHAMVAFTCSLLSTSMLALPLWWIAGRGADALLANPRKLPAPRIRFSEAAISFVLFVGGAFFAIVGIVTVFYRSEAATLLAAFLLWSFLGFIGVRARYQQLRMRRSVADSR